MDIGGVEVCLTPAGDGSVIRVLAALKTEKEHPASIKQDAQ
jgi:hypothetical protein